MSKEGEVVSAELSAARAAMDGASELVERAQAVANPNQWAHQLIGLDSLMVSTRGSHRVVIALIDGSINTAQVPNFHPIGTSNSGGEDSSAHGTFVASLLMGDSAGTTPGICPNCKLLSYPILKDSAHGYAPSSSVEDLTRAVLACVNEGANIINLSVELTTHNLARHSELDQALSYAATKGTVIVAAAGNAMESVVSPLVRHGWVIPVVPFGRAAQPLDVAPLGLATARHGVGAPGEAIEGAGPRGPSRLTGSSVSTPFITGAIALGLSLGVSDAHALVRAVQCQSSGRRRTFVPPLFSVTRLLADLTTGDTKLEPRMTPDPTTRPSSDSPGVAECATCSAQKTKPTGRFVYALGRIVPRFSSLGVEKEYFQALATFESHGKTQRQVMRELLRSPEHRYIARRMCWVLAVEGINAYLVNYRDPLDLAHLIASLGDTEGDIDIDVVLGVLGPIASPDVCNGEPLPILAMEHMYSFDRLAMIKSLPRTADVSDDAYKSASAELFERVMQLADNAGSTDEHRALNYLSVRYPAVYGLTAKLLAENKVLSAVEVRDSRLSGVRKIVDVLFSYTDRATDVTEKFFVRVDVSEVFPFLVSKLAPFYDR